MLLGEKFVLLRVEKKERRKESKFLNYGRISRYS
jgi:hypothetical protein